jgi:N-acetylglucosaminyldiphosphoundecaprenol N-acetyl-beta-D-mannosaminyltransferase
MSTTEQIVGYSVHSTGARACIDSTVEWVSRGDRAKWLACFNPHSYAESRKVPAFAAALRSADWLVPDGAGVVLASRMRKGVIRERVTGSDVFFGLHSRLNEAGSGRIFFLGASERTLELIRARMAVDYPKLEVVGTYSPPYQKSFSAEDVDRMVNTVNAAKPDVLWVGMTAPKQELWIQGALPRLEVKFVAAVGAVFDFYAGRVKRSHPLFQKLGLEWLPRLLQEPRRLWRRMFISAPIFLLSVARG